MSSTAVRWANWDSRRRSGQGSPSSATGGQSGQTPVHVEIYVGGAWTDISSFVYFRDRIKVTRGRSDESATADPQTLNLTLNNRDGRFTPTNPISPLYGLIGRNTPIRVYILQGDIARFRFAGEVVSWPTTRDTSGNDVYVPISAAGIRRRLNQGTNPIRSVMYRALTSDTPELDPTQTFNVAPQIIEYWPCEDLAGATQIASALPGGFPMTIAGTPTLASDSSFVASDALPVMASGSFTGRIRPYTPTGSIQVRFFLKTPSGGAVDGAVYARVNTTGTIVRWEVYQHVAGGSNFGLRGYDNEDVKQLDFGSLQADNIPFRMSVEVNQIGGNVSASITWVEPGANVGFSTTPQTIAGVIGQATSVMLAPNKNATGVVLGQLSVQTVNTSEFSLFPQINAYRGEKATTRIVRLCAEQGVNFDPSHIVDDGQEELTMGFQTLDTFINLVDACALVDAGIEFEPRDQLALTYASRQALYNQTPTIALDYSQHQLSDALVPTADDQLTQNDITMTRTDGSLKVATLTTGAMSIQAPPNGIGDYSTAVELALGADSQLTDAAGWALYVGTFPDARYPKVSLQLAHSSFAGNDALLGAALATDVGDLVTVANPPPDLPPDTISMIVQGYSETFDQYLHEIDFNCSPGGVYSTAVVGDPLYGRADTDGSTVDTGVDAVTGTLLVDTTSPTAPLWLQTVNDTSPSSFPFDILVAGEAMTVTAISGSSSPQTFTVTRSVNGIVKSQTAGTDVRLRYPSIIGL